MSSGVRYRGAAGGPTLKLVTEPVTERLFFTVAETALATAFTRRTIDRFIADGVIPAVRFGSHKRVPRAWLDAVAADAMAAAAIAAAATVTNSATAEAG